MATGIFAKASTALLKETFPGAVKKISKSTGTNIVKGGIGAGADLLPQVTRRANASKALQDAYFPLRGTGTDKASRRAIDAGINTGMIPIEKAEQLGQNVTIDSEIELGDILDEVIKDQRHKGWNDQLTEIVEESKPAEEGVEYQTGHRKRSLEREIPEIDTDLSKAKGNPEEIRKALDTPGYRQLSDRNRYIQIEEAINSPEQIDALITRQEELVLGTNRLSEAVDTHEHLKTLPEGHKDFGKRGKEKGLKRQQKNVKTIERDNVRDLSSTNLRTQDQQVFGIDRQRLRVEALLNKQLEAFSEKGYEWHHTLFGNKEAGVMFLQKISQEPMVALNLMEHLRRLDLPTSGTIGNLTVMKKTDHTKLHNLFRELGLEQSGMLDFADYMKAIGDAYVKGEADVNAIFRMTEIYAEEVAPFLKATEGVGTPMRATGLPLEAGEKYASDYDKKLKGRVKPKRLKSRPLPKR